MTDAMQKSIASSAEVKALGLDGASVNAVFLKLVEARLNALAWEAYSTLARESAVVVNLNTSKPEAKAAVPVPDDTCLPVVHKVSMTKSSGSYLFCQLFGVSRRLMPLLLVLMSLQ